MYEIKFDILLLNMERKMFDRYLQSLAVMYLVHCPPPGIIKVIINYNSSKCIIEAFYGRDGPNTLSLQDFSTVLFYICSVTFIGPVSWISHSRPFTKCYPCEYVKTRLFQLKTAFFKREKNIRSSRILGIF